MMIGLENIPGIGKRIKERMIEHFGSEESAINALSFCQGSVINGISQKKSVDIARLIFETKYSCNIKDVLKNDHIIAIYEELLAYISQYFISDYSRNKISLFFPLGPDNIDLINERYDFSRKSLEFTKKYQNELTKKNLMGNLEKLSMLKKDGSMKKIKNRVIVVDSKKIFEDLKEEEYTKHITIEYADLKVMKDPDRYFKNLASTYEVVLLIVENFGVVPDLMNIVFIDESEILEERLIPEKIIQTFSSNKVIIDAIYNIAQILLEIDNKNLIKKFIDILDLEKIEQLQHNTKILDQDGGIIQGYNKELDHFRDNAKKFNGIIIETENVINDDIKGEISNSSVIIEGEKILDLYKANASIAILQQYIPDDIDELINENIEKGISELKTEFKITKNEKDWIKGLYPEYIEMPVSFNPEAVDKLEFNIKKRAAVKNYEALRDIAEILKENESYLNELIWSMLEFEFFYAIGRFSVDYNLNMPQIAKDKHGILIENSFNLDLMHSTINNNTKTIPISYNVGSIPFNNIKNSQINLLSGSNSGGKTMCLLTLAHSIILAQMGFPCPGNVKYYPIDEIYYFKKSSGQLSAGAFESTLLMFVDLAKSPKEKLILADELEAITEPNAAAKVIGAIFSLLLENPKNHAVFVTHLIEMLLLNLNDKEKSKIRVDGIEATGIDDDLELIIDRNPKFNYIARSTPEFILERLSKMGDNVDNKNFFKKVLMRFKEQRN